MTRLLPIATIQCLGFCYALLAALTLAAASHALALAQQVGREQDIVDLRLGQRMLVDDGTCLAGQIKQIAGAKMTPTGIVRTQKCIPRLGPKTK